MSAPQQELVNLGCICREDFPLLTANPRLVYLDSAASAQKPKSVLEAMRNAYELSYANVHRGLYQLSIDATASFEKSRDIVREFIGAKNREEIIFTHGTTEAINLVAYSWGRANLCAEDEILTTILEHHSNFVPWQLLSKATGAKIRYVGMDAEGNFLRDEFSKKLSKHTKLVAITLLANGLGIQLPVKELIDEVHAAGGEAVVLVDAAQAISHMRIDVAELGADFLVFSGHKLYGPTGIGVLYAKRELLEEMPPFLSGGEMIKSVSVKGTTFNDLPYKFEAGTPNIIGAIGLGAAVQYVLRIGFSRINPYEEMLVKLLEQELSKISSVRMLGPRGQHHALVCFVTKDVHPHDLAQFLDTLGICVRAGHHCAQPILNHFAVPASTRGSVGVYTREDDIYALCEGVGKAIKYFS